MKHVKDLYFILLIFVISVIFSCFLEGEKNFNFINDNQVFLRLLFIYGDFVKIFQEIISAESLLLLL